MLADTMDVINWTESLGKMFLMLYYDERKMGTEFHNLVSTNLSFFSLLKNYSLIIL